MPLLAYFWKVGATLLALLFLADFCLPRTPIAESTAVDRPTIRIHSDRKWPERVVLDTSSPIIVVVTPSPSITEAAPVDRAAPPPTIRAEAPTVANAPAMARAGSPPREAIEHKPSRKTQHVAMRSKRHSTPQMVLAARQPQFAWFGYRYW